MGSLGSIGMGYLASEGQVFENCCKKTIFSRLVAKYKENHAIIAAVIKFGYTRGNVPALTSLREPSKTRHINKRG